MGSLYRIVVVDTKLYIKPRSFKPNMQSARPGKRSMADNLPLLIFLLQFKPDIEINTMALAKIINKLHRLVCGFRFTGFPSVDRSKRYPQFFCKSLLGEKSLLANFSYIIAETHRAPPSTRKVITVLQHGSMNFSTPFGDFSERGFLFF